MHLQGARAGPTACSASGTRQRPSRSPTVTKTLLERFGLFKGPDVLRILSGAGNTGGSNVGPFFAGSFKTVIGVATDTGASRSVSSARPLLTGKKMKSEEKK